jgi:plastocyanin
MRLLGIIGMALVLASCGSSPASPTAPTTPTPGGGTTHTVLIVLGAYSGGNGFSPATLTIPVGDTVSWQNQDTVQHTATANDGTFDSGLIAAAGSFSFKFTRAGTFHYKCTIHGFSGTVTVQ